MANKDTDTLIELENVSYKYPNGTVGIKNVSLKISRGESIAFLGPNGAGKTTLLTIIAGLIKPNRGKVSYYFSDDGKNVSNKQDIRKKIGIVFQDPDPALLSNTVFDEIAFGPLHLKWEKKKVIERVNEIISLMNLEKIKDKHPFHISEGEKKKVLLAAVLVMDPEVIIFDEPLMNLDQETKNWFLSVIKSLRDVGKTLIFATHNIDIVPYIADKIYLINKTIVDAGKTRDILWDVETLKRTKLSPPTVVKIILGLERKGIFSEKIRGCITIEELIEALSGVCPRVAYIV